MMNSEGGSYLALLTQVLQGPNPTIELPLCVFSGALSDHMLYTLHFCRSIVGAICDRDSRPRTCVSRGYIQKQGLTMYRGDDHSDIDVGRGASHEVGEYGDTLR